MARTTMDRGPGSRAGGGERRTATPSRPAHCQLGSPRNSCAKPAPRVDPNSLRWTSHSGTRSPTTLFDPKYTGAAEGTVEEVIDGHIILSTPLSDEARKKIAARTGRPLSAVPDRNVRRLRIMEDGPSEASLRAQIGEKLRLELKRDVRGNMFVTRIEKKLGPGLTPNGAFKDLRKPTR